MAEQDVTVEKIHSLYALQVEHITEAEGGQLSLCPINHILTRIPEKNHGDSESGGSTDELWKKYLEEIEKQDGEMIERWKGEADSTIIFVCISPTILSIFSF